MKVRGDLEIAFGSVKGPVREENQDDFLVYEPAHSEAFDSLGRLLAVADGMGGTHGGGEASRVALRSFLVGYIEAAEIETPSEKAVPLRLKRAFERAIETIREEAASRPELAGMGTTLSSIVVRGEEVFGLHVGDSRCLKLGKKGGKWLTRLHRNEGSEHVLTKALGPAPVEPDFFQTTLRRGESLLLMTDGLWRAIPAEEISAVLQDQGMAEAVRELLLEAQRRDGQDNATLIGLRRIGKEDPKVEGGEISPLQAEGRSWDDLESRTPASRFWPWILIVAGVLMAAGGVLLRM